MTKIDSGDTNLPNLSGLAIELQGLIDRDRVIWPVARSATGWACPVCETIWSPQTKSCPTCVKDESKTPSNQQLLLE